MNFNIAGKLSIFAISTLVNCLAVSRMCCGSFRVVSSSRRNEGGSVGKHDSSVGALEDSTEGDTSEIVGVDFDGAVCDCAMGGIIWGEGIRVR